MSETIMLRVQGRPVAAPAGSSVAAALALAGYTATRRSVSGEPRGPLCGMGTCHECRVQVDGSPRLACLTPVLQGMQVEL